MELRLPLVGHDALVASESTALSIIVIICNVPYLMVVIIQFGHRPYFISSDFPFLAVVEW